MRPTPIFEGVAVDAPEMSDTWLPPPLCSSSTGRAPASSRTPPPPSIIPSSTDSVSARPEIPIDVCERPCRRRESAPLTLGSHESDLTVFTSWGEETMPRPPIIAGDVCMRIDREKVRRAGCCSPSGDPTTSFVISRLMLSSALLMNFMQHASHTFISRLRNSGPSSTTIFLKKRRKSFTSSRSYSEILCAWMTRPSTMASFERNLKMRGSALVTGSGGISFQPVRVEKGSVDFGTWLTSEPDLSR
mmetsp:Transcript_53416/g.126340  ORF Transcript_53416/g.126340 Transcript_53416/m.126340 type:complete len:246 (-) Transcript_53416:856-1593(-)